MILGLGICDPLALASECSDSRHILLCLAWGKGFKEGFSRAVLEESLSPSGEEGGART